MSAGEPEPRLNLSAVMASVQNSPPKEPNALALQPAEEAALIQPPGGRAGGKLRQPSPHEPKVFVNVRLDGRFLAGRQEFFNRRFLSADELGEEAPLRKKLMDQDRADRIRLLMRLEIEKIVRHRPPHADGLVRFADVCRDRVLEDRLDGLRDLRVGDGSEFVVHFPLLSSPKRRISKQSAQQTDLASVHHLV